MESPPQFDSTNTQISSRRIRCTTEDDPTTYLDNRIALRTVLGDIPGSCLIESKLYDRLRAVDILTSCLSLNQLGGNSEYLAHTRNLTREAIKPFMISDRKANETLGAKLIDYFPDRKRLAGGVIQRCVNKPFHSTRSNFNILFNLDIILSRDSRWHSPLSLRPGSEV
ncbi:hypothetical protein PGTUg99_012319 [Puccinia graminis f. sp. tritici]|uniref:Uncharacterized protein n=1 Tax=Puccinia graminis f. sp. tritici TaxID=56615 RepID=A0A5B0RR43_PUCGR|nr:hypothetical protein PGTUg99_012319 [Puccinia graminis f. sp. tritici]